MANEEINGAAVGPSPVEQFNQLIAQLDEQIAAVNSDIQDAEQEAIDAETAFEAAESYLLAGADPVNVTYAEAGPNNPLLVAPFPNSVGYLPETGYVSIQPLPNKDYKEYNVGAPNFDNLGAGLAITHTGGFSQQIAPVKERLYNAWIDANSAYADWQQKLSYYDQNLPVWTDEIDQLQAERGALIEARNDFISSGLTPQQAADAALAQIEATVSQIESESAAAESESEAISSGILIVSIAVAAVILFRYAKN